ISRELRLELNQDSIAFFYRGRSAGQKNAYAAGVVDDNGLVWARSLFCRHRPGRRRHLGADVPSHSSIYVQFKDLRLFARPRLALDLKSLRKNKRLGAVRKRG